MNFTNHGFRGQIQGKWYVQYSNFPMCLKGDKTNPTFNYTPVLKNNKIVLLDEVEYQKKNKSKTITGFDKPINTRNTAFVWRGKGFLFFARSKWQIDYCSLNGAWMLISFEKSLFTPAGYDVITRDKELSENLQKEISSFLSVKIPDIELQRILQY